MRRSLRFGRVWTVVACAAMPFPGQLVLAAEAAGSRLSYNRDIRPILVENCFSCHGADSASRQADLRLDRRDDAVAHGAILPGDPDSTPILDRVNSEDPDVVMPPPATKKRLTAGQQALLARWVAEGAEYEPHWSFLPPTRPEPPAVKQGEWIRTPIDRFILARLEAEGLAPAPEADRHRLARRAALDVTGLPPDPALVEAFVNDPAPDAYERFVDRLLARAEWGEHRGRHWLDYARYADTHGIHFDNFREMWSYRQWVIDAFNRNEPFDRFTLLQLAGDLLPAAEAGPGPEALLDARIGSGFNRCNMTTNEGGIIDEEYLVLYTRDRTETTSTVWMGLTTGCAVCHDHKFDPLSQREFYELAAFFNNTTQAARDGNIHDTPPILPVPRPEDRSRFAVVERDLPAARSAVETRRQEARPRFEEWLAAATPESIARGLPQDTPLVRMPFSEGEGSVARATLAGRAIDLPLSAATKWQPGPTGPSGLLLDGRAAEIAAEGDFEHDQPFTVTAWVRPPANDSSYSLVARMDDASGHRGWDAFVQGRRLTMHLVHAWPGDAFKVVATDQLPADAWTLVGIAYDGSGRPEGVSLFYDGKPQKPRIETNAFKKNTIRTSVPLTIGSRSPGSSAHGVGLADLTIWGRRLSDGEVESLARERALIELVKLPAAERAKQAGGLYDWWLASQDGPFREASARVAALEREMAEIRSRGTVAHVMNEKAESPVAFILERGEYDRRGEKVGADTPDILPPFPTSLPRNRLGLARWLVSAEHPLTARVTVNRFWQEVFGTGLVRTSGDFGVTGELPSHPELLDWLAVEFRESGWDVKRLFRLLLTSAAYRQAATTTPEKLLRDADNRLLSRGPRFRMDAEMVRDHALAAGGLLVRKLGGPSVKPYQPDGVWEAVSMGGNTSRYQRESGENLYRRSLYWFWKRSAPPASMEILNAPSRENCCVRRERTNTPLQALVTLNDPQFVEAARALADRVIAEVPGDSADAAVAGARLDRATMRLLSRSFDEDERRIALDSLAAIVEWYAAHPDDAGRLVAVGESKPGSQDVVTLAAWTMLVNELMNLDEVLCK
jgi:hypothetical protein